MGAPPKPGRPTEGSPPNDEQPSVHIAMAASMLRSGRDPARVAATTEVPLALVQLIAEHLPPGSVRLGPGSPSADSPEAADRCEDANRDPIGSRWDAIARIHTQQPGRRRRIRIMQGAVICSAVNVGLVAVAALTNLAALTVVCAILALVIYAVLLVHLVLPPPDHGPVAPHGDPG